MNNLPVGDGHRVDWHGGLVPVTRSVPIGRSRAPRLLGLIPCSSPPYTHSRPCLRVPAMPSRKIRLNSCKLNTTFIKELCSLIQTGGLKLETLKCVTRRPLLLLFFVGSVWECWCARVRMRMRMRMCVRGSVGASLCMCVDLCVCEFDVRRTLACAGSGGFWVRKFRVCDFFGGCRVCVYECCVCEFCVRLVCAWVNLALVGFA